MENESKKVSGVTPEDNYDNRTEATVDASIDESTYITDAPVTENASDASGSSDLQNEVTEAAAPAEDAEAATAEIVFTSDFTASEVRKKAVAAQKKKLLNGYPKALLYSVLMTIPTMLVFIFGMSRLSAGSAAGKAIEIIALLLPVLFGGPLMFGLIGGCMDISRGGKFTIKRLFFAFKDSWFTKALKSYLLFVIVSLLSMIICMLPAIIVSALSSGLSDGFAAIATNVIIVLLYIGGIVLALQFIFRLALMIPLLIDHPDMKVMEAANFSVKAMRGNTWKFFILMLSYIGWYVLSIGIAAAVVFITAYAGYAYAQNIFLSGDIYTAYMIIIMGVYVVYAEAYILMTIAVSTFILRPYIAWAAFYDTMTGYEPPETFEEVETTEGFESFESFEEIQDEIQDDTVSYSDDTANEEFSSENIIDDETADAADDDNSEITNE